MQSFHKHLKGQIKSPNEQQIKSYYVYLGYQEHKVLMYEFPSLHLGASMYLLFLDNVSGQRKGA